MKTKSTNSEILKKVIRAFDHDIETTIIRSNYMPIGSTYKNIRVKVGKFIQKELDSGANLVSITNVEAYDEVGITHNTDDFGLGFMLIGGSRIAIYCKNGISFQVVAKFDKIKYID
jgi:hypothetical protein